VDGVPSPLARRPVGDVENDRRETNKEKSIVEIYEQGGMLYGKIVKLLQEKDGGASKLCTKCEGADHNKPMLGLVIIKNMKREGDVYKGGTILDPAKGTTYKSVIKLLEGGDKLQVKGCVAFICKSQYWYRVK